MNAQPPIPYFLVDAFADRAFTGNSAAVCLLDRWPNHAWLQSLAMEMNLSETAYLVAAGQNFELRWFTPAVEVDLCGHATLASACVLWHTGRAAADASIAFTTRSGTLTARRRGNQIELDFPLTTQREIAPPAGLAEALGGTPRYVGQGRFDLLVEVESEAVLRALAPDFRRLAALDVRGIMVTARSASADFDFLSRFFAPAAGIDEDPVTGSAHCTLADFWRSRLGKSEFRAFQASARGGALVVRIAGDRVLLAGSATIVAQGQLTLAGSPPADSYALA